MKIVKRIVLIVGILVWPVIVNSQSRGNHMPDSVKNFMDTVFNVFQKKALNRDSINWLQLRKDVYQKVDTITTIKGLIPTIRYMFDQVHDDHGSIVYKGIPYGAHNKPKHYSDELMAQIRAVGFSKKLRVAVLDKGYNYVLIPSIETLNNEDVNKYAQQIKDSICSINAKNIRGWIIDLRLNPGGNMYAMLAGIGGILGNGNAGTFIDKDHRTESAWSIVNTDVYIDSARQTVTVNHCSGYNIKNVKIAVLIGPFTQSSGEAVAISLEGRPNTMFFGENTGGFTTANETFILKYNMVLSVAAAIEADRKGRSYRYLVKPDVVINGGDNFMELNKDKKIQSALVWLKGH